MAGGSQRPRGRRTIVAAGMMATGAGGAAGNDRIGSSACKDKLAAGAGNDVVNGGKGRDALRAGAGRHRLIARDRGRDYVDGGKGRDRAKVDRLAKGASRKARRKADRILRVERML